MSTIFRARKPLSKHDGISKFSQLACAVLGATFIFGTIPASATLTDEPAAMATPLSSEEPPQPPQLSDEEQQALDDEKAGTLKNEQKDALNRAKQKLQTGEKYDGTRNKQKRNNQKRGRRR